jgi:integrase
MAAITPRKNKEGDVISDLIRVHRGRDPLSGKQLKPYSMTWKPDPNRTEKQNQDELNRQMVQFEAQCSKGTVALTRMKVADFIPVYLDIMRTSLSPLTLQNYKNDINRLVVPTLGHLRLDEVKPAHVQEFIQQVSNMPRRYAKNGEKISAATVNRHLVMLKSIFSLAVKQGYIAESPAKSGRLVVPKIVKPKTEFLSNAEAVRLLAALEDEPLWLRVFIELALNSGARRGEIVALKFSDVDYDTYKITISNAAIQLTGQPTTTKPTKDYEIRDVTVDEYCINLIKALEKEKAAEAEKLLNLWHDEGWLFTQWNGKLIHPDTPSKRFKAFMENNGLTRKQLKSLRHTSATLLLQSGVSVKQVQERLGHSKLETTNKYLHYLEDADADAANRLSGMLRGKSKGGAKRKGKKSDVPD